MAGRISAIKVGLGDELQERRGADRVRLLRAARAAPGGGRRIPRRARNPPRAAAPAGARRRGRARGDASPPRRRTRRAARSTSAARRSPIAGCAAPFRGNVARLRVKASESVPAGQPLVDVVNPACSRRRSSCLRPGSPGCAPARGSPSTSRDRPELPGAHLEAEFARRRRQPAARGRGPHREGRGQPAARHGRRRGVLTAPQALATAMSEAQSRSGAARVRAAHPVGDLQPRSRVPRGERRLAGARLRPGGAVALGRVRAAADRGRLGPRRRLGRQPVPAMAGAPGAVDHPGLVRPGARLGHRRAARSGGDRRRGLVPDAPAALPAARARPAQPLGGLLFLRAAPFTEAERARADWVARSAGYGLWAWRSDRTASSAC